MPYLVSMVSQKGLGAGPQRLGNFVILRQKTAILTPFESHFARF